MLTFLAPAWLFLLLLCIPVLLLHMRRRTALTAASLQVWRAVTVRASARRSRRLPPFSWPLVLQLLAVLLAALALARPALVADEAGGHLIVILDNSVAMLAEGDLEAATAQLRAEVNGGAQERTSIILTAGPDQAFMAEAGRAAAEPFLKRLPETALPVAADWDAVRRIVAALDQPGDSSRLLVLGAPGTTPPALAGDVAPAVSRFAGEQERLWLQETRVERSEEGGFTLSGLIRLPEAAPETVQLNVSFRALGDGSYLPWSEEVLPVAALEEQAPGLHAFALPLELPLSGVVRVELAGAAPGPLSRVNHTVRTEPAQARVLLLGQPDRELVRALAAVDGLALYTANSAPEGAGTDAFDLLVTSGLPLPATETNVLSFAAPGDNPLQAPLTTHWLPEHPLSAGVSWESLEVTEAARLPLLPGADELFSGNGLPLVQARTTPGGRQVVVAFLPAAGNWTELTGFPAFLGNVLDWVLPGLRQPGSAACEAGRACSPGTGSPLVSEDGSSLAPPGAGPTVLDFVTPLETGVYWPETRGPRQPLPLAVNAAAPPAADAAEAGGAGQEAAATRELWRPLLFLLLLVLLAEAALTWARLRGRTVPAAARRRQLTGLGLRGLTVALGVLALLDPVLPLPSEREQVAVLIGGSAGADEEREGMAELARATAGSLRSGQTLDLLSYGPVPAPAGFRSTSTSLHDGLNLALAGFNPELPGRVVLASDGRTDGTDVRTVLPRLERHATSIDFLPLSALPGQEVFAERLLTPGQVNAGDRFILHATVTATAETSAVLRLYRDGEPVSELEENLVPGRNLIEFVTEEDTPGEVLYEVEVVPAADTFAENNRQGAFVHVLDEPRVLVVARQSEWGAVFADALRLQGLDATVVLPNRAPHYLDGWLAYQTVVLLDIPSIDLTVRQQELLEEAVREHGRGLLIMGGPNSYGPGGYFETVLERLSPLSSRVPREAPNVALAFVLDRSGSMQQLVDGDTNRLDIARQATLTAASLLHEESRVTIVVFDSEASMLVPLQDELDMAEIEEALDRLTPGGGTAIYPGLAMAYDELKGVDAAATHVIVMTDGLSQPGDFETLLRKMTADGITVSAVAIGDGADVNVVERLARLGGGTSHATHDFRALPSILSQESLMLSGMPIEENTVQPAWTDRSAAFVQGLPEDIPEIGGFVLTTKKDGATAHLEVSAEDGDDYPLLASWRYGNGRVLAFTSEGVGSWTQEWMRSPAWPQFWSRAIRSFVPAKPSAGLNLSLAPAGDRLRVTAELLDEFEEPVDGSTVTVNGLPAEALGRGLYRAELPLPETGELQVTAEAGELSASRSFHVGYPSAFDFSQADPEALALLAGHTGGRLLQGGEPLFTGGQRYWQAWHAWPPVLLLALLVFLFELLNRYDPLLFRKERRA